MLKHCTNCSQDKDTSLFTRNRATLDGLKCYCISCCKALTAIWRSKNREKHLNGYRLWALRNPEANRKKDLRWAKNNPAKANAKAKKREARILKATPLWLTKAHYLEIQEIYLLAKELRWLSNEPLHVDHIIPLRGKEASGLHVPWNLQITPKSVNLSKGNKVINYDNR